ncbi:MAG TPA: restriction endonuclease [Terriglobales bacterium]|jgi:Restriction endonuclease|nr:restriction endonuclease [Terriglobales bacterium]
MAKIASFMFNEGQSLDLPDLANALELSTPRFTVRKVIRGGMGVCAQVTYTNNRAVINEKKGADAGIDARAYFMTGKNDNAKIIFQVKSGGVKRGDIATLRGDMGREKAALAVLITLEEPSRPMLKEAKAAGQYLHETMGRSYDQISIVTIREIVEEGKRLAVPMSLEVLAAAKRASDSKQIEMPF